MENLTVTRNSRLTSTYIWILLIAQTTDALPQCTTQPSDLANLSDTVLMACSVSCYSYADTGPVMTWYDSTGLEVSANNTGTKLSPNFVIQETAAIPTVQSYTCRTNFTTVPRNTGSIIALNVPSYNSTCSTLPINVAYAPFKENITVTPSTENELYTGSTLSCSASTIPEPYLYQWSNESGVIATSPVLTLNAVGDNLKYWCTVWNTQGGNELEIVVNVLPDPALSTRAPTDSAPMPCCTTDRTALIVGVVLVALSLFILIIVCCLVPSCPVYQKRYRQCKDEKPKEVNSGTTRNAEQPYGINAEFNQIDLSHTYYNLQIQDEILDTARNSSSSSQTGDFSNEENEQVLNYAELQSNPISANRRHTHPATSTLYEHGGQVGCDISGDHVGCDKTERTVYTAVVRAY